MPEFLFQSVCVNGRKNGKQAAFMEATVGNKDMPAGVKSWWKIQDRLYGDERTDIAVESHTSFDFRERHSLTENCNRVTHAIIWLQTGHQGSTLSTEA